jgi:hypothetical protein
MRRAIDSRKVGNGEQTPGADQQQERPEPERQI